MATEKPKLLAKVLLACLLCLLLVVGGVKLVQWLLL